MSGQRTDRVLTCFRIGDPEGAYPIYDSEGARLYPGRWNTPACPVIYTAAHYSTAMLDKLVHVNSILPPNQHYIRITVPNGTSYEVFQAEAYPGWDSKREEVCKAFGEAWYRERRSALLMVPSIPARIERNVIVNPLHPDAASITHDLPEPVWWDDRCLCRRSLAKPSRSWRDNPGLPETARSYPPVKRDRAGRATLSRKR